MTVAPEATMPFELNERAKTLQREVRDWLEVNAPAALKGVRASAPDADWHWALIEDPDLAEEVRAWTDKLLEAGFMCLGWPKEYGGRGLTALELAVVNDEFHRADVPRVTRGWCSEGLVGPAIVAHGTDEQKAYFLPRIIDGTDRYCQGFSEPDAGSDLAGLRTRGVVRGDEITVNGEKVWTSQYQATNMICVLCRTDPSAPKHGGISFVLMSSVENGIQFGPLTDAGGAVEFAQTYINDAHAPLFNVIGDLNNGWRVATSVLADERSEGLATRHVWFEDEFWRLVDEAKRRGQLDDPRVRGQLAWAYSNVQLLRMNGQLVLSALATGQDPGRGTHPSIYKLRWSEYARRVEEIALEILGPESLVTGENYQLSQWQDNFLRSRTHTIHSGTSEIQLNILAERVLGLPREVTR